MEIGLIRGWLAPIVFVVVFPFLSRAASFDLPGTTAADSKLDMGFFAGGDVLNISVSGTILLEPLQYGLYETNPDGSLAAPVTDPNYLYANVGATGYPTVGGGDGINHYPGGGMNYDWESATVYGFAGKATTDTTDPATIRFGCVVATFLNDPSQRLDFHRNRCLASRTG